MNSLRVARAALRARPAAVRLPFQRRGYAEAVSDKAIANPPRATQSIYKSEDVVQVNIPAESGEMGVLANHVPSIEQLKAGLVEVVEEGGATKKFFLLVDSVPPPLCFSSYACLVTAYLYPTNANVNIFTVSGGFAVVQPNSSLSINAPEAYPLEDFSAEAVRAQISEVTKVANGSGSEAEVAEAKVELEVLETLQALLK
ncbi:hypothetical protein TD95_000762 [Thielaviopsis punctulata]|uniref:ATP synthase subunit delta, mitochondrial n=1 Tax=Thielaviopsis punctulata TaxID=72032 RepID=A0A0F4ZAF8_9PEZI|nr:hypothetical protein TD95_000762 [Thielaviopsis punctulata]